VFLRSYCCCLFCACWHLAAVACWLLLLQGVMMVRCIFPIFLFLGHFTWCTVAAITVTTKLHKAVPYHKMQQ
jgi:hypothetical protein